MYSSHEYAGLEDMAAMLGLVSACWRRDWPYNRFHIGDVYWGLGTQREETPQQSCPNIRLWTAEGGETVGFAWLEEADAGDVLIGSDHRQREIEEEMLDWIEERHQASVSQKESMTSLQISGYQDLQWQRLLEELGYVREDRVYGFPHFWRSLDTIEQQAPPDGVVVRSVGGEQEATKRTMLQRAAFAALDFQVPGQAIGPRLSMPDQAEIERRTRVYKNVMRLSGYHRELDIVAVTVDGEFVACCTCWLDSKNRVGEFEPVGCHPSFRRRGLARAVMNEGLRRLKSLGAESAVVYTNPYNLPAIRLYESCGFKLLFSNPVYRKTFVV